MSEFMSPGQAWPHYELKTNRACKESEIERTLRERGIAAIEMPLSPDDFQHLSEGFAVALEECPDLLRQTLHTIDNRYGGESGYTRKDRKINYRTGQQTSDPKNYFHFSEQARGRWREQFAHGPKVLRNFLEDGYEIHDALLGLAKQTVGELENTHPNMSRLYFPEDDSFSFLRLLRYDGYQPDDNLLEVAKPHYDIGGLTIQAYADAPGFWAAKDGVDGQRRHYDTAPGEAYTFLGKGHEKVYGKCDELQPLWHGVDRIVPAGISWVPERTAVILFVDAPEVDYHLKQYDTLPHLTKGLGQRSLETVLA